MPYDQLSFEESLHALLRAVMIEIGLLYTVFIQRRYRNFPFWPTVYIVPFSYPASNEDCCIRKYLSVYTMPFSQDNISVPFSYENGIV